jgi:TRAP-type C4-dicarboxylate transport system substrate-binding protein
MKRKILSGLMASVCLILTFAMLLLPTVCASAPAPVKPIKLSYSDYSPASNWWYKNGEAWMRRLEEKTNHRLKITCYPGGTLLSQFDTYDGVLKGVADIGLIGASWTPGTFPISESVLEMPGIPVNSSHTAIYAKWDVYKKYAASLKQLSKVKVLMFLASTPMYMMSQGPINQLEDLKGKRIKVYGVMGDVVRALDAVPVEVPTVDTFIALQRKAIDGWWGPPTVLEGFKLAEVTNSITFTPFSNTLTFMYVMNLGVWNSLPKDIQKIIEEDVETVQLESSAEAFDAAQVRGLEYAMKTNKNWKNIFLSDEEQAKWIQRIQPVTTKNIDKVAAMGLPAHEVWAYYQERCKNYNKKFKPMGWWIK